MPTLEFKGKQHIYAHHLTVPYRPLEPDETRSCNPTDTDDNLIIHGDNLHALKALLPRYANRIKGNYIGQRELTQMGIIFCQLPDALHER